MPRTTGFENVEAIARTLLGVEVTKTWGQPALKVGGTMFACIASHKSAEQNTLVVKMDFAQRDALIEEEPETYYLKEHYVGYPCVLVRLSRVHPDAIRGRQAHLCPICFERLRGRSPERFEGRFLFKSASPAAFTEACPTLNSASH